MQGASTQKSSGAGPSTHGEGRRHLPSNPTHLSSSSSISSDNLDSSHSSLDHRTAAAKVTTNTLQQQQRPLSENASPPLVRQGTTATEFPTHALQPSPPVRAGPSPRVFQRASLAPLALDTTNNHHPFSSGGALTPTRTHSTHPWTSTPHGFLTPQLKHPMPETDPLAAARESNTRNTHRLYLTSASTPSLTLEQVAALHQLCDKVSARLHDAAVDRVNRESNEVGVETGGTSGPALAGGNRQGSLSYKERKRLQLKQQQQQLQKNTASSQGCSTVAAAAAAAHGIVLPRALQDIQEVLRLGEGMYMESQGSLVEAYTSLLEYTCLQQRRDAFACTSAALKRAHGLTKSKPRADTLHEEPSSIMKSTSPSLVSMQDDLVDNLEESRGSFSSHGTSVRSRTTVNVHSSTHNGSGGRLSLGQQRRMRLLHRLHALPEGAELPRGPFVTSGRECDVVPTASSEGRSPAAHVSATADTRSGASPPRVCVNPVGGAAEREAAGVDHKDDSHRDHKTSVKDRDTPSASQTPLQPIPLHLDRLAGSPHGDAGDLAHDDDALGSFLEGYVAFLDSCPPYFFEDYATQAERSVLEDMHVVAHALSDGWIVPALEDVCQLFTALTNEADAHRMAAMVRRPTGTHGRPSSQLNGTSSGGAARELSANPKGTPLLTSSENMDPLVEQPDRRHRLPISFLASINTRSASPSAHNATNTGNEVRDGIFTDTTVELMSALPFTNRTRPSLRGTLPESHAERTMLQPPPPSSPSQAGRRGSRDRLPHPPPILLPTESAAARLAESAPSSSSPSMWVSPQQLRHTVSSEPIVGSRGQREPLAPAVLQSYVLSDDELVSRCLGLVCHILAPASNRENDRSNGRNHGDEETNVALSRGEESPRPEAPSPHPEPQAASLLQGRVLPRKLQVSPDLQQQQQQQQLSMADASRDSGSFLSWPSSGPSLPMRSPPMGEAVTTTTNINVAPQLPNFPATTVSGAPRTSASLGNPAATSVGTPARGQSALMGSVRAASASLVEHGNNTNNKNPSSSSAQHRAGSATSRAAPLPPLSPGKVQQPRSTFTRTSTGVCAGATTSRGGAVCEPRLPAVLPLTEHDVSDAPIPEPSASLLAHGSPTVPTEIETMAKVADCLRGLLKDLLARTVASPAWHARLDKVYRAYLVAHVERVYQHRCRLLIQMKAMEALEKRMTHRDPLVVLYKRKAAFLPSLAATAAGGAGSASSSVFTAPLPSEPDEALPVGNTDGPSLAEAGASPPPPPPPPPVEAKALAAPRRAAASRCTSASQTPGLPPPTSGTEDAFGAATVAAATATTGTTTMTATTTTVPPSFPNVRSLHPEASFGTVKVERRCQRELNSIVDEALAHWAHASGSKAKPPSEGSQDRNGKSNSPPASEAHGEMEWDTSTPSVLAEIFDLVRLHVASQDEAPHVRRTGSANPTESGVLLNEARLRRLCLQLHMSESAMDEVLHTITPASGPPPDGGKGGKQGGGVGNAPRPAAPSSSSSSSPAPKALSWLDECGWRRRKTAPGNRFSSRVVEARERLLREMHQHVNLMFVRLLCESVAVLVQRLQHKRGQRLAREKPSASLTTVAEDTLGCSLSDASFSLKSVNPSDAQGLSRAKNTATVSNSKQVSRAGTTSPSTATIPCLYFSPREVDDLEYVESTPLPSSPVAGVAPCATNGGGTGGGWWFWGLSPQDSGSTEAVLTSAAVQSPSPTSTRPELSKPSSVRLLFAFSRSTKKAQQSSSGADGKQRGERNMSTPLEDSDQEEGLQPRGGLADGHGTPTGSGASLSSSRRSGGARSHLSEDSEKGSRASSSVRARARGRTNAQGTRRRGTSAASHDSLQDSARGEDSTRRKGYAGRGDVNASSRNSSSHGASGRRKRRTSSKTRSPTVEDVFLPSRQCALM